MPQAINRRDFIGFLGALGGTACWQAAFSPAFADPPQPRTNILVILADDLGYADVGFQGCQDIPTPNVDMLARGGVRFSSGYVSAPLCSPTRAGLMTGRYQQRFGHEFNPGPNPEPDVGLPLSEKTFADLMKSAGYATGLVGKWHLGADPKFHPLKRGFDEFFGFLGGAHAYLNLEAGAGKRGAILRGETPVEEKEYLTDALSREAVAFIEKHQSRPFFLYLSYNAVHTPMQATQRYLDRFPKIEDKQRRTYAAMVSAMDDGIGAALKRMTELSLSQDTLIFFLSDNGGPTANGSLNTPLRGHKGGMHEGRIRVPFVARWPRRLPAGRVYEHPVIAQDILATALAAASAETPREGRLDGVNLIPHVRNEKDAPPHDTLFWRMGPGRAMRQGNWKLVGRGESAWELYDLSHDIGEANDLAAQKPDVVGRLDKAYQAWNSELAQPLWSRQQRPRKQGRKARQKDKE